MRKNVTWVVLLAGLMLTACSNSTASSAKSSPSSAKSSKVASKAKVKKAQSSSEKSASASSKKSSSKVKQSSSQASQQEARSQSTAKSQGEINRERGYDPKGNPVMPGQDHAPGSDVYGNPDPWVQGQIDWMHEQQAKGYMDENGNLTDAGRQAMQAENSDYNTDDSSSDYSTSDDSSSDADYDSSSDYSEDSQEDYSDSVDTNEDYNSEDY